MNKLLVVVSILAALAVGFNVGTFYPAIFNDAPSISQYLHDQNQGCNDINVKVNAYTGEHDVVCEVKMQAEDDAIYIIHPTTDVRLGANYR